MLLFYHECTNIHQLEGQVSTHTHTLSVSSTDKASGVTPAIYRPDATANSVSADKGRHHLRTAH